MGLSTKILSSWLFALMAFGIAVIPSIANVSDHVVISEVKVNGNEYVELYNPTASAIEIDEWYWCYYSSTKSWNEPSRKKQFPAGAIIPAYGYYLIGLDGYPTPVSDWQPYSSGQLNNSSGSVAIFPSDVFAETNSIDAVAWGDVLHVLEGDETQAPGADRSIQRLSDNAQVNGPAVDTDNNANDFFLQDNPNPQNSGVTENPPEITTEPTSTPTTEPTSTPSSTPDQVPNPEELPAVGPVSLVALTIGACILYRKRQLLFKSNGY